MRNTRNSYYDFLKGLAIMGVIAIHTMVFNSDPYSLTGSMLAIFRNLLGCCVPFFVAASGYFLCNKKVNTKATYLNFIKTRLQTVYRPMLIWGLPWLILGLLYVKRPISLYYVLGMYFIGGLSILYFINLIIQLYLLLPIIQKIDKNKVILLSIVSIVVTYGWSLVIYKFNIHPPLVIYCSFPTYIGFFALGCYLGKTQKVFKIWYSISIIIVGLIFAILESYYWLDYNPTNNWLGLKASVQLLAFGVILLLFSKTLSENYKRTKIKQIIEWCGRQSMPIYMSHMLIKFILNTLGITSILWIINWGIVFVLDILFIFVLTTFIPKSILSYWGIRKNDSYFR